jgi:hypothetical protein
MHYQSDAFAKPGTYTILSKTSPRVIQRNLFITDIDVTEIQSIYKCVPPIQQWNEELGQSWINSWEIANNLLSSIAVRGELCYSKCRLKLGCTHYSWSNQVCYLKKNTTLTKENAVLVYSSSSFSGILKQGKKIQVRIIYFRHSFLYNLLEKC